MTEEQIALARRAVACRAWRWMPGMADCWGGRVREGDGLDRATAFPDLTDPATLGCLLALVREALHSPRAHVLYVAGLHRWECADNRVVHGVGATEAEALVAALEEEP
jgi:hypothetical protein